MLTALLLQSSGFKRFFHVFPAASISLANIGASAFIFIFDFFFGMLLNKSILSRADQAYGIPLSSKRC